MKNEQTNQVTAILWKAIRYISLAVMLIVSVFGMLDEILDYPVWERLVAKFGISDGMRFFWIAAACGVAVFLLSLWMERWDPRCRSENPDAAPQGRKPQ